MLLSDVVVRCLTSKQHASVFQGRSCSDSYTSTILRLKSQIQLVLSTSHTVLTPGQAGPALTLLRQVSGSVATGVPFLKSQV